MFNPAKSALMHNMYILHRQRVGDNLVWLFEDGNHQPYMVGVSTVQNPTKVEYSKRYSRFGDAYYDFVTRSSKYRTLLV